MTTHKPLFIRPKTVQPMFGFSRSTLYRWVEAGHLRLYKRGPATFVKVSEIEELLTGEEQAAAPA